jgi:predicted permease
MKRPADDRSDVGRARAEHEIDEELAFHHERTLAELTGRGLSVADAEAEAKQRFGPIGTHRERLVGLELARQSRNRRRSAMGVLTTSLRSVVRGGQRSPGFTFGIVAILTLGLGVNAITFGLVDRLVLSGPAGIDRPGELRRVVAHHTTRAGVEVATTELGYLDYRDLLESRQLAGAAGESLTALLFGSGETAERIQGRLVTANYFSLLGVRPAVGRFFTPDESEREGARVAVLSHAFWQRRFGGSPSAIGQILPIESHRYQVVGVAPQYFTGSAVARVDVFLPLEAASDEQIEGPWRTARSFRWMGAIVRLAPGATDAAAASEITVRHRQAYANVPDADPEARLELVPLNAVRGATVAGELGVAALVGGVALLVMVITFANVANLFLARSLRQRDRVAVRLALGCGRTRLLAEQAAEGALLALGGALVAVLVAILGARPVQVLLFPDVHWLETAINPRVLLFLAACAATGGALAASLPMWQAGRANLAVWLRVGGQRASRTRTQGALLMAQGALSVVLLVGAGLFVRSLSNAQSLDLGVDTGRLLVVSVLRGEVPPRADLRMALRAVVGKIPGVSQTTEVAGTLPFVSSWAVGLKSRGSRRDLAWMTGDPTWRRWSPGISRRWVRRSSRAGPLPRPTVRAPPGS